MRKTGHNEALPADNVRRSALTISGASDLEPPDIDYQLLVSFAFGDLPAGLAHPALVQPGLNPLAGTHRLENWWYLGDVHYRRSGPVRIAECNDYAVLTVELDESADTGIQSVTRDAYRHLMDGIATSQHSRIVKIWNYLGGINEGSDDSERYRLFGAGRAEIFDDLELCDDQAPAGTAIGTQNKRGLVITALTTRRECELVENPRQVSAFHYPRQYGPRAPRFSRAGYVAGADHALFVVSGTAAIVGHESAHPFDVAEQTVETLRNLDSLCETVAKKLGNHDELALDGGAAVRVYLRRAEDRLAVSQRLADMGLVHGNNVVFLHGNICREELMIEIDAAKVL